MAASSRRRWAPETGGFGWRFLVADREVAERIGSVARPVKYRNTTF
jgi:hypothetical protein